MYKVLFIIASIIVFSTQLSSQIVFNELPNDERICLEFKPLLSIEESELNKLILRKLSKSNIDFTECAAHSHINYYEHSIIKNKVIESKILRGICQEIDSALLIQSRIILDVILPNINIDSLKKYSIIIPIRFFVEGDYDSTYIEVNNRIEYKTNSYVFEKKSMQSKDFFGPRISANFSAIQPKRIPINIDECISQLDIILDSASKENMKKESVYGCTTGLHFSLGLWLRNYWGLWGDSRLAQYFNNLGVYHPDDMSSIILACYYRYLHNQEIEFEEEVNSCYIRSGKMETRESQLPPVSIKWYIK